MKRGLILIAVLLSGCVEPTPPQKPSPAVQALTTACQQGDTASCKTLAELEQRERERIASIPRPVMTPIYLDPTPFQRPLTPTPVPQPAPLTSGMKVCPNGMIVQQFYIC